LFSPILRPSDIPPDHAPGAVEGSFFRFTDGAARTVSCAQSLHGLFGSSFFANVDDLDFEGATVAVVVAERFDTTAVLLDINGYAPDIRRSCITGFLRWV